MSKKMPTPKKYQIPFDKKTGEMLSYPAIWEYIEWRDVYEFDDVLTYKGYGRGRSSVLMYFVGSDNTKYPMFISDFHDVIENVGINGKQITGKWTFCKRGQNYGLKMVQDERESGR